MSEAPRRQAVVLGLFVTIGLAILIATLLTIGNLRGGFGPRIHVTAEFPDVTGLTTGDSVWYAGVPVGRVDRVRLSGPSQVAVDLAIDAHAGEHIPADVVARIGADGLIGNQIVVLSEGTDETTALKDGATLETGTSNTPEELLASLQDIATDAKAVSGRLARGDTLEALDEAVAGAAELVGELQEAASDARTPVGVLLGDTTAGGDLEDTLENLSESSVLLSENLEAMQHNFLLRGFFKRKARQEREEAELDTFTSAVLEAGR